MNANYTQQQIVGLPLSEKERCHESRSRRGVHVFLSRFYGEFSALPLEERILLAAGDGAEDASVDSTDTIVNEGPKFKEIMQMARQRWRSLSEEAKNGWNERADNLNSCPTAGKLEIIPEDLDEPSLEDNVKIAISQELRKFSQQMKPTIVRRRARNRSELSQATYKFGKESVTLQSQRYKKFTFNYLLKLTIFGTGYRYLTDTELVENEVGKKTTLVHFCSLQRMREVFTHANLNTLQFLKEERIHTCCAKVNTRSNITNRDMIGYIFDKDESYWTIKLLNNNLLQLPRGIYLSSSGVYHFPPCQNSQRYITQYWPVRMKVTDSGEAAFTFNRVCMDNEQNLIGFHCT